LHTGLEDAPVFLEKARLALESLHKIDAEILRGDPIFSKQMNFLNRFNSIRQIVPGVVLIWFYRLFRGAIECNLKSRYPKLFLFDFYKLGYYATLQQKKIVR
jgi:hypothetical protein